MASGDGKRFLGTRDGHGGHLNRWGPADLLAELEELDHDQSKANKTEARAAELEESLKLLFEVAPKDASGNVDAKAARYILGRIFVERHGWFVNGIEAHGAIRNSSRIAEAMGGGRRFSLRQLARFAATLEALVHGENADRLERAFGVFGYARHRSSSRKDAQRVIEAYMVLFVMTHQNPANPPAYWDVIDVVEEAYPTWRETKAWAQELTDAILSSAAGNRTRSLWDTCLLVVEEIGERYGRWQNKECMDLKAQMLEMEIPGTGRVPLHAFWGNALHDRTWAFTESVPYLEQLGALEGSEAPYHSVLIPNYVYSAANCVAGSKYYDVCCINECDTLLGQLEALVRQSSAEPGRLVELVGGLATSSVAAPRELPRALTQRLEQIAAHHSGLVPLHGRLFAQFLHHAFPRECPYPHLSSTRGPKDPENWIQLMDEDNSIASHVFIKDYLEAASLVDNATIRAGTDLPWTDDEELFMQSLWLEQYRLGSGHPEASMILPLLGVLLAALSMLVFLRSSVLKALGVVGDQLGKTPKRSTLPTTDKHVFNC